MSATYLAETDGVATHDYFISYPTRGKPVADAAQSSRAD